MAITIFFMLIYCVCIQYVKPTHVMCESAKTIARSGSSNMVAERKKKMHHKMNNTRNKRPPYSISCVAVVNYLQKNMKFY